MLLNLKQSENINIMLELTYSLLIFSLLIFLLSFREMGFWGFGVLGFWEAF